MPELKTDPAAAAKPKKVALDVMMQQTRWTLLQHLSLITLKEQNKKL
mgnify:CR=1 FL=1